MSNPERPENLDNFTIIGLGMIGGSIAKDIHNRFPDATVLAIDASEEALAKAEQDHIIDGRTTFDELGRVACTIIIATPLDSVIPIAKKVHKAVRSTDKKLFVLDVGSVKTGIVAEFQKLSDENIEFISTHPMAGTEFAGFAHAKKDLFQAKPWMICPHDNNTEEATELTQTFITQLGGRVRMVDAVSHDRNVAVVSHAVIMLSNYLFDYVASEHPEALDYAGDGFTSTTRLASGNPKLHQDILASNFDHTQEELEEFTKYLTKRLDDDLIPSKDFFEDNMQRRNRWLHKRK